MAVDTYVLNTQKWLNKTYNGKYGYNSVEENGQTGWNTIYALIRALQIELGISEPSNNFGNQTKSKFNEKFKREGKKSAVVQQEDDDESSNNVYGIIQGALFCKGYGIGANTPTCHFYNGTGNAIKKLKSDAGLDDTTSDVTLNIMKALLSMDAFVKVANGDFNVRTIQQYLNKNYEEYIGISPCDGVYSRDTNRALIYAIQAEEGLTTDVANGNFGPTTQRCCPTIPYNNVEKNYKNKEYDLLEIGKITILLKAGLYFNGFAIYNQFNAGGMTNGSFDNETKNALKKFQEHYKIPVAEKCDLTTWMSILVSSGDTSRSSIACDTRFEMTDERIKYLKDNKYQIVGRYLTGGDFKELRAGEADRILSSGLKFFPIFQESGTDVTYFTEARGKKDAQTATTTAKNHRIPRGTIIYFAVDTDPQDWAINSYILPYFKALRDEMTFSLGNYYNIGIYSTRNVCNKITKKGYALTSFISDMSTGFSGNMGFKIPDNWNFDQFYEIKGINGSTGKWDLDKDSYSERFPVVTYLDKDNPNIDNSLIYLDLLKQKLFQLYEHAKEYIKSKNEKENVQNINLLVSNYLRQAYDSTLWSMVAGKVDWDFVNYVNSFGDSTLKPEKIIIPKKGYKNMSISHLAATLNARIFVFIIDNASDIKEIPYPSLYDDLDMISDDLAGWAGDLLQMGSVYCGAIKGKEVEEEDLYFIIGGDDDALANKYLSSDGKTHSASEFGYDFEDWNQDIDAINIALLMGQGKTIYDAFYDYYTKFYEIRYDNFINEIIHYKNSNIREELLNQVKYYTKLKSPIATYFVNHFEDKYGDYDASKIGDALAEQFVNKLMDYYDKKI